MSAGVVGRAVVVAAVLVLGLSVPCLGFEVFVGDVTITPATQTPGGTVILAGAPERGWATGPCVLYIDGVAVPGASCAVDATGFAAAFTVPTIGSGPATVLVCGFACSTDLKAVGGWRTTVALAVAPASTVTAPNVHCQPIRSAASAITSAGLSYVPAGKGTIVVSQAPTAGYVSAGSYTVTIYPPPTLDVPPLTGLSPSSASSVADGSCFVVALVPTDATAAVTAQSPVAGVGLAPGSTVTVFAAPPTTVTTTTTTTPATTPPTHPDDNDGTPAVDSGTPWWWWVLGGLAVVAAVATAGRYVWWRQVGKPASDVRWVRASIGVEVTSAPSPSPVVGTQDQQSPAREVGFAVDGHRGSVATSIEEDEP